MILTQLSLENFRNHKLSRLSLSGDANLIFGPNGAGKTNLLEGIYYFALARAHARLKDAELVTFGAEGFRIRGTFETDLGAPIEAVVDYFPPRSKALILNGEKLKKSADLVGQIQAIFFSPRDLELILGGPTFRRQFINILLSQTEKNYFLNLKKVLQID